MEGEGTGDREPPDVVDEALNHVKISLRSILALLENPGSRLNLTELTSLCHFMQLSIDASRPCASPDVIEDPLGLDINTHPPTVREQAHRRSGSALLRTFSPADFYVAGAFREYTR